MNTARLFNSLGVVAVVVLMVTAYYMQYIMGLQPCPLCMLQRFILVLIGLVLLVAAVHNPGSRGAGIYAALTVFFSIAGLAAAGRHVWLQHLPADEVPACAPSWDYLIDAFPLKEVVRTMLHGSGDCAEVSWTFLGLSIPEWMLPVFAGFAVLGIVQFIHRQVSRGEECARRM
jgi:disulfide bond formation protein DsbB